MAKKLRVGVVGAGFISGHHLRGYQNCPNAEVLAVCDIVPSRAEQRAEEFDIPNCFTSIDELLSIKEIDAVSICTPNICLLYTSPSPRDLSTSRMPSSA